MNVTRTQAMVAALFCAVVAALKSRGSLAEFLRVLPVSSESKSMALESYRGVFEQDQVSHERRKTTQSPGVIDDDD